LSSAADGWAGLGLSSSLSTGSLNPRASEMAPPEAKIEPESLSGVVVLPSVEVEVLYELRVE